MALQGTALGGVGYGAAGTIRGSGEREYHYGATPQGPLELRLIMGDRAMVNMTVHEYYVSGVGSTENRGSENIARGTASFTLRVYDHHAIALRYIASTRDVHYSDLPDRHQTVEPSPWATPTSGAPVSAPSNGARDAGLLTGKRVRGVGMCGTTGQPSRNLAA